MAIELEDTLHADGSLEMDADRLRVSQALQDAIAAVPPPPTSDPVAPFTWAAGAASIDVSSARVFAATNTLTANSVLTLTGGVDGSNGVIAVKHDATATVYTLGFTVAGRTIRRDLNVPDTNPLALANAETEYHYLYYTLAGTAYCRIFKAFLQ